MNIKRIFPLAFIAVLILSQPSCTKKGQDDPLLSLRTRKNRVVGEWKADKGRVAITDDFYVISYTISGNTYTAADNFTSMNGTAATNFKFEKNGDCYISINLGGFMNQITGTWNFTGRVGDHKNKSQIVIHPIAITDPSGTYAIQGNDNDFTYEIEELRNKTIVISSSDRIDASSGQINAFSENWTLIPN